MIMKTKAPAKINLYLDITGRRPDGYHNIRSIMQSIDLCDTVSVEIEKATAGEAAISISCSDSGLPCDESNLACKAALAFFRGIAKKSFSCRIHIDKVIPMAAGLAGGSSDAAAVLKLLNALHSSPFDADALCDIGAEVGADVPFCIRGGTLIAEGIGDKLRPCYPLPKTYIAVAVGGRGVSTPDAYRMLDLHYNYIFDHSPDEYIGLTDALRNGDLPGAVGFMYNAFEEVVLPMHRAARKIRSAMKEFGALGVLMSGSGPSVFGVFESKDDAKRAAESVGSFADFAFSCSTDAESIF